MEEEYSKGAGFEIAGSEASGGFILAWMLVEEEDSKGAGFETAGSEKAGFKTASSEVTGFKLRVLKLLAR